VPENAENITAGKLSPERAPVENTWNREELFPSNSDLFIWAYFDEYDSYGDWDIKMRNTSQIHIAFTSELFAFHSTRETVFVDSDGEREFSVTNFTLQNLVWEPGMIQEFIMPDMPRSDRAAVADYSVGYRITGTVSNTFKNRWSDNNSTMTVYVFLHKDDPSKLLWVRYFFDHPNPSSLRMDKMAIDSGFLDEMESLIEAQKIEEEEKLQGQFLDAVRSVEFTPDSSQIITSTENGPIILWDLATRREVKRFIGHVKPHTLLFTPDGRQIISASEQTIKLWDIETGDEVWTYTLPRGYVGMVSFSPTGRQMFVVMSRGSVILDVSTGNETVQTETFPEVMNRGKEEEGFSPDGRYTLSGDDDGTFKLFDAETGSLVRTFSATSQEYSFRSARFSPDGRHIVSTHDLGWDDWVVVLWDVETGNEIRRFTVLSDTDAEFSPDSRYLLVGHHYYRKTISDVASGKIIMTLGGENPSYRAQYY